MRLLAVSDLHLEYGTPYAVPPGTAFDVAVLAGDIGNPGTRVVEWAAHEAGFGDRPVLLVPGNHEFYGTCMADELARMKEAARGTRVHVMDRHRIELGGVRFLGCMLWTDFRLAVGADRSCAEVDVARALAASNRAMNDFRLIDVEQRDAPNEFRDAWRTQRRTLRAEDTLALHWIDRDWLRRELEQPFDGPTVVVTHHAPSATSLDARYAASWSSSAFVSDLPDTFFAGATHWLHGHTHTGFDVRRGSCRIVCNPRGRRMPDGSFENRTFRADCVVAVGSS